MQRLYFVKIIAVIGKYDQKELLWNEIQVRVMSGHGITAQWLPAAAVIIVLVHKRATALTHCTTSVQWLQCLHTVCTRQITLIQFTACARWDFSLTLSFSLCWYEVEKVWRGDLIHQLSDLELCQMCICSFPYILDTWNMYKELFDQNVELWKYSRSRGQDVPVSQTEWLSLAAFNCLI